MRSIGCQYAKWQLRDASCEMRTARCQMLVLLVLLVVVVLLLLLLLWEDDYHYYLIAPRIPPG